MSEEKELRVWGDPGSYNTQEGTEEWGAAWRENPGNLQVLSKVMTRVCV